MRKVGNLRLDKTTVIRMIFVIDVGVVLVLLGINGYLSYLSSLGIVLRGTASVCIASRDVGNPPFPDLRAQLLSYFGQELIAHAGLIFATLTALFAFISKFTFKVRTRQQSLMYTFIVGFLFAVLFYSSVRMLLYGNLVSSVMNATYDPSNPFYGWNLQNYYVCGVLQKFDSSLTFPFAHLLKRFSGASLTGSFDPFNGLIIAPFSGFIAAKLFLHVFGNKSESNTAFVTWPFFKYWSVMLFIIWLFAIVVPPKILFGWALYLVWLSLTTVYVWTGFLFASNQVTTISTGKVGTTSASEPNEVRYLKEEELWYQKRVLSDHRHLRRCLDPEARVKEARIERFLHRARKKRFHTVRDACRQVFRTIVRLDSFA